MENDKVMIHVRFAPDGSVATIGERPSALSEQDWFNLLASSTTDSYETLFGRRALFRLPKQQVEQIKSSAA